MKELSLHARNSVNRQADLFRLAKARHGLDFATLETLSGIPRSTLRDWSKGTVMPAWAIGELGEAGVPDELLSLITAPFNRDVTTAAPDDGSQLDDLGEAADELASKVRHARHPKSIGGVAIVPQEASEIKETGRRVVAMARAVQ